MRPRRPAFSAGHYYHIYNRGAHRDPIFVEADNYEFVLRRIKRYLQQLALTLIAYCLSPNHYHWLVRQDGDHPAGRLAQRVFNSYTKAFNKRYARSGTLFEGPYKAIEIERPAHLLHLCRYIHANPVVDGLVDRIEQWPYSNYFEWIESRPGTLVDRGFVREHFPAAGSYAAFVQDYLREKQLPQEIAGYLEAWEV